MGSYGVFAVNCHCHFTASTAKWQMCGDIASVRLSLDSCNLYITEEGRCRQSCQDISARHQKYLIRLKNNNGMYESKKPTSSSLMMRTQSLRMLVGAPSSFVKAFRVLYLKGGPATCGHQRLNQQLAL